MKCQFEVTVKNGLGLHARPATALVKKLKAFQSNVSFTYNGETVNAKSVMNILLLAAAQHAKLEVLVEGSDAEEVKAQILETFEQGFGED